MNPSATGAIILAAGSATRMGQPKQLLPFEGETLLRRATNTTLASRCAPVIVVVGANAPSVAGEVESLPVIVARNDRWSEGMGTSVRAGLEALERSQNAHDLKAAVFLPCDQPHLSSKVLNRLIDVHDANGKAIVVSGYEGIWGVPMLFARQLWPELRDLQGNRGAQSVALRHAENVECVPFPLGAFDLDTREDYERLLSGAG